MELAEIQKDLIKLLRTSKRWTVLTGAGISAESGIPTFRDAQEGLWAQFNPEELATREGFLQNPRRVWEWYAWRRNQVKEVKPNPGHFALAEMEKRIPHFTLITQNIDGLHRRAGSRKIIELHGNIQRVKCFEKDHPVESWEEEGDLPPRCPRCGSMLRPDVVWFGEMLPPEELDQAFQVSRSCDLFFSIGTSSLIQPAASLPFEAMREGIPVVEINPEETPLTPLASYSLRGLSGEILPKLIKAVWSFLLFLVLLFGPVGKNVYSGEKIIDLTHPFDEQTIYWPTEKGFVLEKEFDGITDKGYYYAANKFSAPEHGGTHIDAPIHFNQNGKTVDQIPPDQLMGEAVLIDVSKKVEKNRDYQIAPKDFIDWEKTHGTIPKGAIILLRTGFEKFWPHRVQYLGTDQRGKEAVSKLHFPGLGSLAAGWLIENRFPKAVGLDTASIDYGQSTLFETHRLLFGKNIPALENLAHLDELPPKGFRVIALPMKIKGGSGGPLRAVAVLPDP